MLLGHERFYPPLEQEIFEPQAVDFDDRGFGQSD